ncbi:MAG: IS66 family insertion sequence element accessory protein TnpB [Lachnospiraceae bacterium]|nr:IS66 family insertion sequence element accessory protein TnpB [Lachnospiraceae bacterium]
MKQRVCKEDQIKLIMECRQSGLSDYQWCEKNGIHPGNFYNWVSKLRKSGYTFPEPASRTNALPNIQEVVKVDLIPSENPEPSLLIEQNASHDVQEPSAMVAAELLIDGITLRLFNGADKRVVQSTLQYIEYSCAVKPHVRSDGNRQSGTRKPLSASLLA